MRGRVAALLCTTALITGCAIGPRYLRPSLTTPDGYRGQLGGPEATSLADLPWWEVFRDQTLTELMQEALQNNYDLRTAAARVEEARAVAGVTRGQFLPQVEYQGAAGQAHSTSQLFAQIPRGETRDAFLGAFHLAWELDIWGRIRHSYEAAVAELFGSEEFRRGVVLTLVSEVAQAYFELRELDLELEIAQRTVASFQRTLDLFTRRLQLGVASKLEVARAEAALAATAATIPNLERFIVAKENQLSVLLGRAPGPIPRGVSLVEELPPPELPVGLPSQLLERRPDIREAEQALRAANAQVGVAQASFFPSLGLTGLRGGASDELKNIVEGGASIWSIAGSLAGPLFHGGQILETYRATKAQWEQTKLQYEQTVLKALQEVSNAITDRQKLAEAQQEQARTVTALQESVRLSTLRYTGGFANYFEVIEAQQQLFPAENILAQIRRDQLIAIVRLYKALGGGWALYTEPPALPPPWYQTIP